MLHVILCQMENRVFFFLKFRNKGTPQPTKGGAMALSNIDIATILSMEESQTFDRKSVNISPRDFSNHVCAFANADGGIIVVGISDKTKRIEGVDNKERQVNELLRVPMDFCIPTVPFAHEFVECIDSNGKPNHVLVFRIEASPLVHENQAHNAYVRVGDKSKILSYEDRMTLSFDKGLRSFEDILLPESSFEDVDKPYLNKYLEMIKCSKEPREYLLQNKNYAKIKDGKVRLSVAAILLFGKNPQQFFPRARVRFIRYEGIEEKFGAEMNVVKDVVFEGRILEQIRQAVAYIQTQIKERTYLTKGGIFTTEQEYHEFVRTELIVNAVTHRLGLPIPEYRQDSFILKAIVKNAGFVVKNLGIERVKTSILNANLNATTRDKLLKIAERIDFNQVFGAKDLINELKCSPPTATELIKKLKFLNLVEPVKGAGKSKYVFSNMDADD